MKFRHIFSIIFLLLLFFQFNCLAQYTTSKKKAIKHYEKGMEYYKAYNEDFAMIEMFDALDIDPNFIEAYLMIAEIYRNKNQPARMISAYDKAVRIDSLFFPKAFLIKGSAERSLGRYEDAKRDLEIFLYFKEYYYTHKELVLNELEWCNFALQAIKNPVPFAPENLGSEINSEYNEYWPTVTADDEMLIFTRLVPIDKSDIQSYPQFNLMQRYASEEQYDEIGEENFNQEDFFSSKKISGKWQKAINMGAPMNTLGNEGAQSISANGQHMVYTSCHSENSFGSCDLFYSYKIADNKWAEPLNMGYPINSENWESQPALSADGRQIYFTSNIWNGCGGKDLYMSYLDENNKWVTPINLGPAINTKDDEESPFIHPDGKTLYFSSNGHVGMGGMDIFITRWDSGTWQPAKNLGYPINTFRDEIGFVVVASGKKALFASERDSGGYGGLDIYQFDLYEDIKPNPVTYAKGIVYDATTNLPLQAHFQLIDIETTNILVDSYSMPSDGSFLLCLTKDKNYALNVSKDGYLFYSENFSLKNYSVDNEPFLIDIPLQPILTGEIIVLKNIFFETDSYTLKTESYVELKKLVEFLNKNSKIEIEISGHTDNEGSEQHNIILSENRAKAVVEYLVSQAIEPERLTYKGYGFSQPIATNDTELGRALNRRTEVKIK